MANVVDRSLRRCERIFNTLAITAMFVSMIVVSLDVFFRYAMNAPQPWVRNILVLYLLPGLFFFGLPGSYNRGVHVSVDILSSKVSPKGRLVLSVLARVVGVVVFALIAWFGWFRFAEGFDKGEIQPGILFNYSLWPSMLLVPAGCALAALRSLERLVAETAALVEGGEAVDQAVSREMTPEEAF